MIDLNNDGVVDPTEVVVTEIIMQEDEDSEDESAEENDRDSMFSKFINVFKGRKIK